MLFVSIAAAFKTDTDGAIVHAIYVNFKCTNPVVAKNLDSYKVFSVCYSVILLTLHFHFAILLALHLHSAIRLASHFYSAILL